MSQENSQLSNGDLSQLKLQSHQYQFFSYYNEVDSIMWIFACTPELNIDMMKILSPGSFTMKASFVNCHFRQFKRRNEIRHIQISTSSKGTLKSSTLFFLQPSCRTISIFHCKLISSQMAKQHHKIPLCP